MRRLRDEHSSAAGATLTAMLWSGRDAALAHIGNSRAYLLRDQVLFHITKDHTLARLRVEAGEMSEEDARSIHHVLSTVEDPQRAATRLVDEADAAGRPDNIACVVVDLWAGP